MPGAVRYKVDEPQSSVPAALDQFPEKVWLRLVPRFRIPPVPLMVSPAPETPLWKVAVPEVFVIDTFPAVVKPEMVWSAAPVSVTPPLPLVKVPPEAMFRLPPRVRRFAPGVNVAPAFITNDTLSANVLAPSSVMAPVPPIITPPDVVNKAGHSEETVLAKDVALY